MKNILLLMAIGFVLSSCSIDDNNPTNFSFEILPIQTHGLPEEFVTGETYTITVGYTKPNPCYEFNDFYFLSNSNERTIAVINSINNDLNCSSDPTQDEASFNFFVNGNFDHYVFKFWQGSDGGGNDTYMIVEVPVVE
ncbi:hypothetical protein [Paucihalobacter sp.]|uniref:hypothetical protein n=1 Tax=Paucihalobacter sp. TaxID=2850405 RepID=UPI002FE13E26